jgi:hypothetical protein
MKVAVLLAVVATTLPWNPLAAQQDDGSAPGNGSGKTTYASTAGGYGDLASSHAYEMSTVTCELDGKLDSKMAKAGDGVVLRTTDKTITSDGTQIPRGARLVGHVTEVAAYDPDIGPARIAIAFDRAELKKGQSVAIFVLIRDVRLGGPANASRSSDESMVGMPISLGAQVNGGRVSPDYSASATVDRSSAPDQAGRDGDAAGRDRSSGGSEGDAGTPGPTEQAGGDMNGHTGAHELAAARAVPRATRVPGVLLAGNSSSSGVLLAPVRDIEFESGTQFLVGVAADR